MSKTARPTRPNLWARAEHDSDGNPTGRVKVASVTEEMTRRGWEAQWDTLAPLATLDATDAATLIATLGRALADATRPPLAKTKD